MKATQIFSALLFLTFSPSAQSAGPAAYGVSVPYTKNVPVRFRDFQLVLKKVENITTKAGGVPHTSSTQFFEVLLPDGRGFSRVLHYGFPGGLVSSFNFSVSRRSFFEAAFANPSDSGGKVTVQAVDQTEVRRKAEYGQTYDLPAPDNVLAYPDFDLRSKGVRKVPVTLTEDQKQLALEKSLEKTKRSGAPVSDETVSAVRSSLDGEHFKRQDLFSVEVGDTVSPLNVEPGKSPFTFLKRGYEVELVPASGDEKAKVVVRKSGG